MAFSLVMHATSKYSQMKKDDEQTQKTSIKLKVPLFLNWIIVKKTQELNNS